MLDTYVVTFSFTVKTTDLTRKLPMDSPTMKRNLAEEGKEVAVVAAVAEEEDEEARQRSFSKTRSSPTFSGS